ncbi:MAG: Uncharacterised protein [Flavobacteriaceae bacterium]|nr:MAG: Uncharacterised protein [Flavobacteriaceae bacterium]
MFCGLKSSLAVKGKKRCPIRPMVGSHPFSWVMFTFIPSNKGDKPLCITSSCAVDCLFRCSTKFQPSLSSRFSNKPNLSSVVLYVVVFVCKTSSSKLVNSAPDSICKAPRATTLGASVASGRSVINSGLSCWANMGKNTSVMKSVIVICLVNCKLILFG